MRASTLFGATLLLASASAAVHAELASFLPRPTQNGAFLSADASWEDEELQVGTGRSGWTDTFSREKLTVFSDGYLYHPRFLQYRISVGGVFRQEKYKPFSVPEAPHISGTGIDYNARLLLLPEHPYHADLFAERYAPQFKDRAATEHDTVGTTRGAAFHYKRKPYFLDATAQDNALESTTSHSDVKSYRLSGQIFKEYRKGKLLSLGASANPTRFTGTGVDGRTRDYSADGLFSLPRLSLSTSAGKGRLEQEGDGAAFRSEQRNLLGRLTATLPLGFRASVSGNDHREEGSLPATPSEATLPVSNEGRGLSADVSHRLYQSLDTSYVFLRNRNTSSEGRTTLQSHSVASAYTKHIGGGRLHAGASGGWTTTESRGQVDVVNEPHAAQPVPGAFTLAQPDIVAGSIRVFLKSPVAPFENVLLTENVDYVVLPVLNTLEIRVLGLPARFVVPATCDFFVFYELARATFGLRSQSFSANVGADLFDERLAPFASYTTVRSHVTEGALPGPPLSTTTRSAGLAFHRGGLQARAHYDAIDWDVSPSHLWAIDGQYRASFGPTTRLSASATYQDRRFPRGVSAGLIEPTSDELAQVSGGLQQQLFSRTLSLAGSGSYSRLLGRARGKAYGLNGSVSWRTGKLTVDAGASASWADAEAEKSSTERTHQFYYVSLRRNLY